MRELETNEMFQVTGAGGSPQPPSCETRTKNNNGYGNGAESGPPPGNSGDHNPQLTSWNSGPKGPR
jgi:hypothetical protein